MLLRWIAVLLAAWSLPAFADNGRIVHTGPTTVYVSSTGSDTTGDGTSALPWATPQHAWDTLYRTHDLNCYPATIQAACAASPGYTYYPGLKASGRLFGQCGNFPQLVVGGGKPNFQVGNYAPVTLRGNPAYPTGCFIYPNTGEGSAISLSDGASLKVDGWGADTSRSQQDMFQVMGNSLLEVSNLILGNAGMPGNTWSNHFSVAWNASLMISGPYTVGGSAFNHMQIGANANMYINNNGDPGIPVPITFTGNPHFACTIISDNSWVFISGVTFSGAVTAKSTCLYRNGVIETSGAKNIPGTAGTTDGAGGNFYH